MNEETVASRLRDFERRVGFSTASLPNRTLTEAADIGRGLGMNVIELLSFAGYRHTAGELAGEYLDQLDETGLETLRELLQPFRGIGIHAPFWDVAPFSPNPVVRDAARTQLRRTLTAAGAIGANTVTTHVIPRAGREFEAYRDEVIALYRELGDVAAEAGVTLTIETIFTREIEEFAALIHGIAHPAVGANVDVGHLRGLLSEKQRRPETLAEAYNDLLRRHVLSLGERVYHMHLHDVQAEGVRDHRECGTGVIHYPALFGLLADVDYSGLFVFELEEADDAAALGRSRDVIINAMRRTVVA